MGSWSRPVSRRQYCEVAVSTPISSAQAERYRECSYEDSIPPALISVCIPLADSICYSPGLHYDCEQHGSAGHGRVPDRGICTCTSTGHTHLAYLYCAVCQCIACRFALHGTTGFA